MTYLKQRTTQRAVTRAEERRRVAELAEKRRTAQIKYVLEFIGFAFEAEGVAHARPARWEVGDELYRTARPAMEVLRISENGIRLLCSPSLHAPATAYSQELNQAVWQDGNGSSLAERLEPFKAEFLAVTRGSFS